MLCVIVRLMFRCLGYFGFVVFDGCGFAGWYFCCVYFGGCGLDWFGCRFEFAVSLVGFVVLVFWGFGRLLFGGLGLGVVVFCVGGCWWGFVVVGGFVGLGLGV